jgi:hypothetical protein
MVAAYSTRTGYPMNWGHHVVLFDGTFIYDFDFTRNPNPLPPPRYFDEMFKNERIRSNPSRCLKTVGAYELRVHQARDYLDYQSRRGPLKIRSARLRDLPKWGCGQK